MPRRVSILILDLLTSIALEVTRKLLYCLLDCLRHVARKLRIQFVLSSFSYIIIIIIIISSAAPVTSIDGGPDIYVSLKSRLALVCRIASAGLHPHYLIWRKGGKVDILIFSSSSPSFHHEVVICFLDVEVPRRGGIVVQTRPRLCWSIYISDYGG